MLYFDNGSIGVLVNNWLSGRRLFRVELHAAGVFAEVESEVQAKVYVEGDTEGDRYAAEEIAGSDELWGFGGFRSKHREFVDSLFTGKDTTSSPFRRRREDNRSG